MDVVATVWWNAKVSRVLGLLQLSKSSAKQEYQLVKWRRIYPIFLIFLILIMSPLQIYMATGYQDFKKFDMAFTEVYWNILNPFAIIAAILCSLINQKKMCWTVNRILRCIRSVQNITGAAPIYTASRGYLLKFLLIWLSMIIWDVQYYFTIYVLMNNLELLYVFLVISSNSIFLLTISSLIRSLKKELNRTLKKEFLEAVPEELASKKIWNLRFIEDCKKQVSK